MVKPTKDSHGKVSGVAGGRVKIRKSKAGELNPADSMLVAELRAMDERLAARNKERNDAFRAEWHAKLASSAPKPLVTSPFKPTKEAS